jgi:hypothetical protein
MNVRVPVDTTAGNLDLSATQSVAATNTVILPVGQAN